MIGGYDSHGIYYPNVTDGINAEINGEINGEISYEQQRSSNDEEIHRLWSKIQELEERIAILEHKI